MRWELENIHRVVKTDLGVGDAQVRHQRLSSAVVAYWALMLIVSRLTLGAERHEGYGPLPKWVVQRRASFVAKRLRDGKSAQRYRPSVTDIRTLVQKGVARRSVRVLRLCCPIGPRRGRMRVGQIPNPHSL